MRASRGEATAPDRSGRVQTPAGIQLNSHQKTTVRALSVSCPVCGAEPWEALHRRRKLARTAPPTSCMPRERELARSLSEATGGLAKG